MAERIPQSTSYLLIFKAYLASDHVTEATGKTIAITISKNGGAFGNPNAGATNATEISSGWYKVTLDTTDTGTIGPLAIRGAEAAIDDVGVALTVADANTGGYGYLDAAVSTRLATSGYTAPSNLTAAQIATGVWTDTTAGDFTTALSVGKSVMNGVTLGTGLTVNQLTTNNDKTGYSLTQSFPSNFASLAIDGSGRVTVGAIVNGAIAAATFAANALDAVWSTATRLLTAGTNIVLAKGVGVTGFTDIDAAGVRSAIGLASANLDTQIAAITAPDNAGIAAIKTQTDKLTFTVANQLDANIQYVNDVQVNGTGANGNEWGP